jgi:hypothetical protein
VSISLANDFETIRMCVHPAAAPPSMVIKSRVSFASRRLVATSIFALNSGHQNRKLRLAKWGQWLSLRCGKPERLITALGSALGVSAGPEIIFKPTRFFSKATRALVTAMEEAQVKRLIWLLRP